MFTVYLPDGVTVTYEGDAGLPVGQAYRLAWRIRETGYQGAGVIWSTRRNLRPDSGKLLSTITWTMLRVLNRGRDGLLTPPGVR